MLALCESGRDVSLKQLNHWRHEGLLPPLLSKGRGLNRGKVYYWADSNVLLQAQRVHDLLKQDYRHPTVILILWLCGHSIPLPKVRRAWLHRARQPKHWPTCANKSCTSRTPSLPSQFPRVPPEDFLLNAALTLCGIPENQHRKSEESHTTIRMAAAALGFEHQPISGMEQRLPNALKLATWTIENCALLSIARTQDIEAARGMAEGTIRLVQLLVGTEKKALPVTLVQLAESLGIPLFLCALLMQTTGYRENIRLSRLAVEDAQSRIANKGMMYQEKILESFRSQLTAIWYASPHRRRVAQQEYASS